MRNNPYIKLAPKAFWKKGVAKEDPHSINDIYSKKFSITKDTKIAAAGSCFAQHITRHLKKNGFSVIDEEPAPKDLPKDEHNKYGYSLYSARYGNIYTVRQLLQLAEEVSGERKPDDYIFEKNGRFFDGLRPTTNPDGFSSIKDLENDRSLHIESVKRVFRKLDILIFTLGLTEMWVSKKSGTVFPTAPGVVVGEFDPDLYKFENAYFNGIIKDFEKFRDIMLTIRENKPFKVLLTVSPVPLAATASNQHVLVSNTHSKAILRAVAGTLSMRKNIDYFPSYEIVTNPKLASSGFKDDFRTVKNETVEIVMRHFFKDFTNHKKCVDIKKISNSKVENENEEDVICEDQLLEEFSKISSNENSKKVSQEANFDYEYENIESFLSTTSVNKGVHMIRNSISLDNYNDNFPLVFKIVGNLKSGTILSNFNGTINRKKTPLPYLWGLNSDSTKEKSIQVFFCDPLLYAYKDANLCWYALSCFDIAKIISHIKKCTKANNVLLMGNSGGGIAALSIFKLIKNATVLICNPQTNLLKYKKNAIERFLDIFKLEFNDKNLVEKLERLNIIYNSYISEESLQSSCGKIYYFQEKSDKFHIENHLKPFLKNLNNGQNLENLKSGWINEKVFLNICTWRRSDNDPKHMAPPVNLLLDCMDQFIAGKCISALQLDQYNAKRTN